MTAIAPPSILQQIVDHNRRLLPAAKRREPQAVLEARIACRRPARDFPGALKGDGIRVIAEVKSASPSAGVIRGRVNAVAQAKRYAAAGASAISVLTERKHFGGSLRRLGAIATAFEGQSAAPPLVRKDFLFDPYQVYQARAYGGDTFLLIVAILEQAALTGMLALGRGLGMEALVEVHDEAEVERAVAADARVIGINNRDLNTFAVSLETTGRLRKLIPADRIVVSESGIKTRNDMHRLRDWGADAVLIGETLMTAPSLKEKLRELLS
jgi:indole-3-glycerol phosphate synthase